MSKICGFLATKTAEHKGKPVSWLAGFIELSEFSGNVRLVPNAGSRSPQAPAYKLEVKTASGYRAMAGGVWVKDGEVRGGKFLTVTVDDDSMSKPVYVTAFPEDIQPGDKADADGEFKPTEGVPVTRYKLVWSRAKPKDEGKPRGVDRPLPASPADAFDDEIPFG